MYSSNPGSDGGIWRPTPKGLYKACALGGRAEKGQKSSLTQGIQANVEVLGVGTLTLSDIGSGATQVVTVTQSTIGGTGLFGNNSAFVSYLEVGTLTLQTGHGEDQYDVHGSFPDAVFTTPIVIDDFSKVGFIANVGVDPDNHLNLRIFNEDAQISAQLFLGTGDGTVSNTNAGGGTEVIEVNFPGELPSQLVVTDFSSITEF
jgi:hypothetical protein